MIVEDSPYSPAAGTYGLRIDGLREQIIARLKQSNSLWEGGWSAEEKLNRIKKECSNDGWDGEDAIAASNISYDYAQQFLKKLPPGLPAPDPGINVNGQFTLEWRRLSGKLLSLTFADDAILHYIVFLKTEQFYSNRPIASGYTGWFKYFLEEVISEDF
jgi:hypothetical protein